MNRGRTRSIRWRLTGVALGLAAGALMGDLRPVGADPEPAAPAAESPAADDESRVKAEGQAAGDQGNAILDGLLPDHLPETPPPETPPEMPPPVPEPIVPPPQPVIAAARVFAQRLADSPPPAEVRRVRHEIAEQLAGQLSVFQQQIEANSNVAETTAAIRLLQQVGTYAAERELPPPPADPHEPRLSGQVQYGASPTYQWLESFVEPVSAAAAGPRNYTDTSRADYVDPINPAYRELARQAFGEGTAVVDASSANRETNEAAAATPARAFGEDLGADAVGQRVAGTNFFSTPLPDREFATSPYWPPSTPSPRGESSVPNARGADNSATPPPPGASDAVSWQPSRQISDLDVAPPPPPIVMAPPGGGAGGDEGGVRIGFSPQALLAARLPFAAAAAIERRLIAARDEQELQEALQEVGLEAAQRLLGPLQTQSLADVAVLSLKQLCEGIEDHARRGVALPESLRYPGSLRRLVGCVLQPETEDLLLVGSSHGAAPPLNVDDLIVAIQTVWRDGDQPACSLDPDTHDFGGPQSSRILGVPSDCHFAEVMLRADYAMKRVLFGLQPVAVPGFVDLKTRLTESMEQPERDGALQFLARFWFTALVPRAGDIQTSPDGRAVFFAARMQLETETMEVRGHSLGGTGRAHPLLQDLMRQFTSRMDAMQAEVPAFAELQTLFDAVMLASVLRATRVNHPLLHRLAQLRHQPIAVPRSYPGLTTFIEYQGITVMAIQGGVTTRPAIDRSAVVVRADDEVERLRQAGPPAAGQLVRRLPDPLMLLSRSSPPAANAELELLRIRQMIAAGVGRRAIDAATEYLRNHPDVAGYLTRSDAVAAVGLYYLAERDLRLAGIAGADPQQLRLLRARIGFRRDGVAAVRTQLPADDWPRLVDLLLADVATGAAAGQLADALALLDQVAELNVRAPQIALWRVSLLAAMGRLADAQQFAVVATNRHPADAALWLMRAKLADLEDQPQQQPALDWTNRAVQLDPQSVEALLLRARLRVTIDPLADRAAAGDVRQAKAIAPEHPEIPVVQARLAVLQGDLDGALAACNRALRISPGYVPAYMQRLFVRSLRGDTPAAYVGNLRDCNSVLTLNRQDWRTRLVRADLLTKLDNDRLAELGRNPQQFESLIAPVVIEHLERLTILPGLKEPADAIDPDQAQQLLQRIRAGFLEAAAADLEAAADAVPAEQAPLLRDRAGQIRSALNRTP